MPDALTHPTPQELAAFGLGHLLPAAAAAVAAHVEKCPACRQSLEELPPDSFLGKVRAARPGAASLPAGEAQAAAAPPQGLPPELAGYGKYRFVRERGRGGMGVVYQAVQTFMGRAVAVKVMNPAVLAHPEALPRFQAEVRAAARLDHPNIVRAYDAEQVGDLLLLVMEFVEGMSLAELVKQAGPLPVAHACDYARQAALGLQHAFEQGMVHRDIKPHNLMVNARGQVKVLDFGLACVRGQGGGGLTQVDSFMGTAEYVSPEQAKDARSVDTRADIYSLGCTLYFLLAGRPPFRADTAVELLLAHRETEPRPLEEVRPDVPTGLAVVVARMLAKDPAQRYQKPAEVAQALAAFVKAGAEREAGDDPGPAPGVESPGQATTIGVDTPKVEAVLREVPVKGGGAVFKDMVDAVALSMRARSVGRWVKRAAARHRYRAVLASAVAVVVDKLRAGTPLWAHARTALLLLALAGAAVWYAVGPKKQDGGGQADPEPVGWKPRDVDDPEPRLRIEFSDRQRFGIHTEKEDDPSGRGKKKRLTFKTDGSSNNTCVRIDGSDFLFGQDPGVWERGKARVELRPGKAWESVMTFAGRKVRVTQHVEVVPGEQSHLLDTCLVFYTVENTSDHKHKVGLRFLLDTFIGSSDGVPFVIPGEKKLLDTKKDFSEKEIPDYIEALEKPDLKNPGTVVHLGLKGINQPNTQLEPPHRMLICRWDSGEIRWEPEVEQQQPIGGKDSCVYIYWLERTMAPHEKRHMAFTYGLRKIVVEGANDLGLTVGGSKRPGDDFTVTALVKSPHEGQKVKLILPPGLKFARGEEPVKDVAAGGKYNQVSWRVHAGDEGSYTIQATSDGSKASIRVAIRAGGIFSPKK